VLTITVVFLTSNLHGLNVGLNTKRFSSLKDGAGVSTPKCVFTRERK